jgi:hypothetical protein
MTTEELNKIWDNIQDGKYEKIANKLKNLGWDWLFVYPEKTHSDDCEDGMSIPNDNGSKTNYTRKNGEPDWQKMAE